MPSLSRTLTPRSRRCATPRTPTGTFRGIAGAPADEAHATGHVRGTLLGQRTRHTWSAAQTGDGNAPPSPVHMLIEQSRPRSRWVMISPDPQGPQVGLAQSLSRMHPTGSLLSQCKRGSSLSHVFGKTPRGEARLSFAGDSGARHAAEAPRRERTRLVAIRRRALTSRRGTSRRWRCCRSGPSSARRRRTCIRSAGGCLPCPDTSCSSTRCAGQGTCASS